MSKILGSWSGMRKYLETEMLAESLRGRVRYGCTAYAGMDGCHIFDICIDGVQIKRFSWETVNSYFIENGFAEKTHPLDVAEYWRDFWVLLDKYSVSERTEYTDSEFCEALEIYRNQDIHQSIVSEHPIVKMFAVLDRRTGKRTLTKHKETIGQMPQWLQQIYLLRLQAEAIEI